MLHRNSFKYSDDQGVKLDCNWLFFLKIVRRENHKFMCHYIAELQTNFLTTSKYSIDLLTVTFLAILKWIEKLTLINRRRKCKKGKGWRLPLVHSHKSTNTTISPAFFPAVAVTVVGDKKIGTPPRTNQIAGIVTVPSWGKTAIQHTKTSNKIYFISQLVRAVIGQFSGPYSPVRPAKIQSCFCCQNRSWFIAKCP